jgi:hypothetical protein
MLATLLVPVYFVTVAFVTYVPCVTTLFVYFVAFVTYVTFVIFVSENDIDNKMPQKSHK